MKDISASRKTCVVVLAAVGLTFGTLAHAAGGSEKEEGKRTLSRETTHGNESTIGNKRRGTSESGAAQGSRNTKPQGSAIGGSSTDKFTNTDIGGGGTGSGAVLQGGVTTNQQGTSGGAGSMGGMRSGTGQGAGPGTGQGTSSQPGSRSGGAGSGR